MPRKRRRLPGIEERIKKFREDRGWSQAHLAREIGVSQGLISDYETGIAIPTLPVLIDLARAFGVSTDELLGLRAARTLPEKDAGATRLWKKLQRLRSLPDRDQKAIMAMINIALRQLGGAALDDEDDQ